MVKPPPYKERRGFRLLRVTFNPLILIRGEPILRESLIGELSDDLTILDSLNEDNRWKFKFLEEGEGFIRIKTLYY